MDFDGTTGKAVIPVNTEGQVFDFRNVKFPTTLNPATVTTELKARNLTYTLALMAYRSGAR